MSNFTLRSILPLALAAAALAAPLAQAATHSKTSRSNSSAIEQSYQQLKEELGFDHFEGRTWNGWSHHAVLTAITYGFLELERAETGRRPLTFPQAREFVSEVLVMQIWAERPDLQEALRFEMERRAARPPPR